MVLIEPVAVGSLIKIKSIFQETNQPKPKTPVLLLGQGWFAKGFIEHIDKSKYSITNLYRHPFVNTPMLLQTVKPKYWDYMEKNPKTNDFTKLIDQSIQTEIKSISLETKQIETTCAESKSKTYSWDGGYLVCGLGSNTDVGKYWTEKISHIRNLKIGSKICVVGAGPTGTELAFHLSDLKHIPTLYDGLPSVYTFLSPKSQEKIFRELEKSLIPLQTSKMFADTDRSKFDDVIFAVGSRPNDLTSKWKPTNKLTLESNPEVFVGGDCVNIGLPKTAQVAYQQGVYVAQRLNGLTDKEFKYVSKGTALYTGRSWYLVELNFNNSTYTIPIPEKLVQIYYSWFK
jgi:NADH dehydrogenase FAD-containing subunit